MTRALTDPQADALQAALDRGYFDVPRQITLQELADDLGVSHQALSERLRRANETAAAAALREFELESGLWIAGRPSRVDVVCGSSACPRLRRESATPRQVSADCVEWHDLDPCNTCGGVA